MNTNCTSQLFGISQNECDCFTDELNNVTPSDPDWYKKSTSGLYLDELEPEGLVSMRAADGILTCDKTLGKFYQEAQTESLKRTADDVYTMVSAQYKSKRQSFSGRIGGKKYDRAYNIQGAAIAGVMLSPYPIVDGVFNLTAINIGSSITKPEITISIYRYDCHSNDEPVFVQNVEGLTTVANRVTTLTLDDPISLPLEVDGDQVEYMFVYPMSAGEQLVNTSVSCGCGKKEAVFNSYARFYGITIASDAPSMADFNKTTGSSYGISLEGSFICDGASIICRMFETSSAWKKVYAYAARYLAAAIVNERVYKSPDLSRWSMVNFDEVKANAFNFRGEYADRLKWLSQNTDPNLNDCFTCDTSKMNKSTILR